MSVENWPKFFNSETIEKQKDGMNQETNESSGTDWDQLFNEQIKDNCLKFSQGHLIKNFQNLKTNEDKQKFIIELRNCDFSRISFLYETLVKSDTQSAAQVNKPLTQNIYKCIDQTNEKRQKAYDLGLKQIAEGKLAIIILAGGQASRLNCPYSKGMYNPGLLTDTTIFELYVGKIKRLCQLARETHPNAHKNFSEQRQNEIPLLIQTSEENFNETRNYFSENDNFGYESIVFFAQNVNLPSIDESGQVILAEPTKIQFNPNGNGGIYESMDKYNLVGLLGNLGVDFVNVTGIDNILCKLGDPYLLGYCQLENLEILCKYSQRKHAQEKMGVHANVNGSPNVIEYSVIDKAEAEKIDEKTGELYWNHAFLVNFVISTKMLGKICENTNELNNRYNKAFKAISSWNIDTETKQEATDKPNGYKFEIFIFEGFSLCSLDKFGMIEVDRDDEFAPIKNSNDKLVDCPNTAINLYSKYHRKL